MRIQDQVLLALTAWRENRGGGASGMQSVANVIMNRAAARKTDAYTECVRPLQFSSLTAKGDPELTLWPADADAQWAEALALAAEAAAGTLEDITGGATLYYAPASIQTTATIQLPNGSRIPFPEGWNASAVKYACTIQSQAFFTE
jgi:spore germination cell wall hydrolase CwlJ-like protein